MEQFSGLADSRKVPCSSGNHPVHHIFTRVDLSPSWDHWTSGREPENHSSLLMKKIHGIHHQESKVVPGSIIDSVIKREASLETGTLGIRTSLSVDAPGTTSLQQTLPWLQGSGKYQYEIE
ncbi:uncharacterized protein LOC103793609 isoform X1 [Callithrix jacchus]